jgi:hypothetical protein
MRPVGQICHEQDHATGDNGIDIQRENGVILGG